MLWKILLLILIAWTVLCADTKIYIGTENDRLIFGIDSLVRGTDSAGGLEIRNYTEKKGLIVEGREYGAKPAKTVYTLTAGGKTADGAFLKYQHNWSSSEDAVSPRQALQLGYGQGDKILSH